MLSKIKNKNLELFGIDNNPLTIKSLKNSKLTIHEKGLKNLFISSQLRKKFNFQKNYTSSDIYIIAVPTPINKKNTPNLKQVHNVITNISKVLKQKQLIIIESTCPIGSTNLIYKKINDLRSDLKNNFLLAYCPERILPGNLINELIHNQRIVGGINYDSSKKAKAFYKLFVKSKIVTTEASTAEMIKLSENSFRDVNIAFANELSIIANKNSINVNDVIKYANLHPRVNILKPGVGVGGHCIPVDPWFFIHSNRKESKLIARARNVNNSKTKWVIENILLKLNKIKTKKITISLLGLTYKPNSDDLRESPSIKIYESLNKYKLIDKLFAVDPYVNNFSINGSKIDVSKLNFALSKSRVIIILVNHSQFKNLKLKSNQLLLNYS